MDDRDLTTAARRAGDHPALEGAARLGYAVSGVVHLVIGWLGLQLAWSTPSGQADESGAMQALASTGPGLLVLWVAVAGFAGLALWQLVDIVAARRGPEAWKGRLKAGGKAALYVALAWSSLGFARGGGQSRGRQSVDVTASLMARPGGRILVAAVGLAVLAVAAYHVVKGWRRRFLADLRGDPGRLATRAGRLGYVAKGVALAIVGLLFLSAALQSRADQAAGLDGALRSLLAQPFGRLVVTLVAVGFAAYGGYSFARARYARV